MVAAAGDFRTEAPLALSVVALRVQVPEAGAAAGRVPSASRPPGAARVRLSVRLDLTGLPAGVGAVGGHCRRGAGRRGVGTGGGGGGAWAEHRVQWVAACGGAQAKGQLTLTIMAAPNAKELVNSIDMRLMLIPAGAFTMGSPGDESGRSRTRDPPRRRAHPALLPGGVRGDPGRVRARLLPTPAASARCRGRTPAAFRWRGSRGRTCGRSSAADCPPAAEQQAGRVYRLPSEADGRRLPGRHPYRLPSRIVAGRRPGELEGEWPRPNQGGGLTLSQPGPHDLHGNVWEWTDDGTALTTCRPAATRAARPTGPTVSSVAGRGPTPLRSVARPFATRLGSRLPRRPVRWVPRRLRGESG